MELASEMIMLDGLPENDPAVQTNAPDHTEVDPSRDAIIDIGAPAPADTSDPTPIGTQQDRSSACDAQWPKWGKIVLVASAGAVYSSSSMFPRVVNALGFRAALIAISLPRTRRRAARILIKIAAIACAVGILGVGAIANDLPKEHWWFVFLAFLGPAIAVAVA